MKPSPPHRRQAAVGAALLLAVTVAGCSDQLPPLHDAGGFDLSSFGGRLDESLRPDDRARQAVLRDFLNELVSGTRLETVTDTLGGVKFLEPSDSFYQGALSLRRWDFDGPPRAGAFSVRLEFVVDDVRGVDRTDCRAYAVQGKPGAWEIRAVE